MKAEIIRAHLERWGERQYDGKQHGVFASDHHRPEEGMFCCMCDQRIEDIEDAHLAWWAVNDNEVFNAGLIHKGIDGMQCMAWAERVANTLHLHNNKSGMLLDSPLSATAKLWAKRRVDIEQNYKRFRWANGSDIAFKRACDAVAHALL
jgi:hypothetical protein